MLAKFIIKNTKIHKNKIFIANMYLFLYKDNK